MGAGEGKQARSDRALVRPNERVSRDRDAVNAVDEEVADHVIKLIQAG